MILATGLAARPVGAGPIVQGVRHWSGAEYTRVVFDLSSRAVFRHFLTAADPPSLVLELDRTAFASAVRSFAIGDGLVERVRLLTPEVEGGLAQILIELTARRETKVFLLPAEKGKPHRLVIDVTRSVSAAPARDAEEASGVGSPPRPGPQAEAAGSSVKVSGERTGRAAASPPSPRTWIVVIDPGHGGDDPGARGPRGILEKDICLSLAVSLAAELNRRPGIKALLTRNDDTFLTLRRRTRIAAEKKADLFVSIHANANRNRKVYGTEVYFLSLRGASDADAREVAMRENAADHVAGVPPDSQGDIEDILVDLMRTATLDRSSELAGTVIEHLRSDKRLTIRGVKQAGFDVLKTAGMPSILIEAAFISHAKEAKLLKTRDFQREFASNVGAGIGQYLARAATAESPAAAAEPDAPAPVPATSPPAGS